MPNPHETKPHVLTITLDEGCAGCSTDDPKQWCSTRCLNYAVDCPYDEADREHVCMMYVECMCPPIEPPSALPEPPYGQWDYHPGGRMLGIPGTCYAYGSDIIAVAAWDAYNEASEVHDDEHPHGWKPTGACWVQSGDHCWPEPLDCGEDRVLNMPGVYRVAVDNEGSYEDSVLVLYPWPEEVTDGQGAEASQERSGAA